MSKEIESVGVVGLGVMGFDIAFLYAMKGFPTAVFDASQAAMDALDNRREQTIERLNKRNRISESECENVRTLLVKSSAIERISKHGFGDGSSFGERSNQTGGLPLSQSRRVHGAVNDQYFFRSPRYFAR